MIIDRRILLALAVTLAATVAQADTFTVTNTNDSGAGSLRQAILDANVASPECQAQSIVFAIPGNGVHTIQPMSPLPSIQIQTTLDGYTQSGSAQNTLFDGENAVITIEIDGSKAGTSNGLRIGSIASGIPCSGNGSIIDGLVINRFALAGIDVSESPCVPGNCFQVGAVRIYGSFIGTDTTGLVARGNGVGLHFGLNSAENIVGDQVLVDGGSQTPPDFLRNVISGNLSDGVRLDSADSTLPSLSHRIRGNYIGVDGTGTHALGNGGYGVFADVGSSAAQIQNNIIASHPNDGVRVMDGSNGNVMFNAIGVGIGGVALANGGDGIHIAHLAHGETTGGGYPSLSANGIASVAHNVGAGLFADDAVTVDVSSGSFGNNGGLGIDMAPRGVNPNNATNPGVGPNQSLNAPVLLTATYNSSMSPPATIFGELETTPSSSNEIHFYVSTSCDPSGFGEGAGEFNFLNNVQPDISGRATFSVTGYVQSGQAITALTRRFATATDVPTLIVSEFSNCIIVGDDIFADGFGP